MYIYIYILHAYIGELLPFSEVPNSVKKMYASVYNTNATNVLTTTSTTSAVDIIVDGSISEVKELVDVEEDVGATNTTNTNADTNSTTTDTVI